MALTDMCLSMPAIRRERGKEDKHRCEFEVRLRTTGCTSERGRDLQAARPYWFELIPADKMSYEDGRSNIEDWSASHSLRTSATRAF